jgi:hypothetical protein
MLVMSLSRMTIAEVSEYRSNHPLGNADRCDVRRPRVA